MLLELPAWREKELCVINWRVKCLLMCWDNTHYHKAENRITYSQSLNNGLKCPLCIQFKMIQKGKCSKWLYFSFHPYQKETNTTSLTQRNLPTGLMGVSSSLRARYSNTRQYMANWRERVSERERCSLYLPNAIKNIFLSELCQISSYVTVCRLLRNPIKLHIMCTVHMHLHWA